MGSKLVLNNIDHNTFMSVALEEAIIAGERGDKAIGAVLVHNGKIIDKSSNKWNTMNSKVHHAENTLVLNNAQYLKTFGKECIVYTTAEPCLMCLGTIVMAGVRNIVIGTEDPHMQTEKFIKDHEWLNSKIDNYIKGIMHKNCTDLIVKYCDEKTRMRLLKKKL